MQQLTWGALTHWPGCSCSSDHSQRSVLSQG